jgi:hypothetical protein
VSLSLSATLDADPALLSPTGLAGVDGPALHILKGHRVQATFSRRVNENIYTCYAGDSMTFPPDPSDEKMNLPPREIRLFLFADFHTTSGSRNECGFDDYAVWGWDEKSVPVFLSKKAHLF